MSKHTPGPWEGRYCPNTPADPLDYAVIHGGKEVARIWRREDVDLIAAAPDLLAALQRLLHETQDMLAPFDAHAPANDRLADQPAIRNAITAIAKAKGRLPDTD